ncbi:type I restriction enzyme HsdR N-terminal domain-containing protein [Oceanihabitans sp. IOP_32]|nr:type I restriction enzyme HsdR N-terminal domain-containing protein [Oceanihabitans sp. IOP_32]QFZ55781.1 type I restriction enzyme HsdR N-terminal domain-containing protein [Oceanihabitans sp. IOP_32]
MKNNKFSALQALNFPKFSFRLKSSENIISIFDCIRKKFVVLQPEEWVRQHCIQYLIKVKGYPKSLINVEKELIVNTLKKRYDIVIFNSNGSIHLIVECKAPSITINQNTFDQIAQYNLVLNASYLMVTNGLNHYYCQMDFKNERYNFLKEIPNYKRSL